MKRALIGHWGGPGQGSIGPASNHGISATTKAYLDRRKRARGPPAGGAAEAWGRRRGARQQQRPMKARWPPPARQRQLRSEFDQSGKFLMQIRQAGKSKGSNDTENLRFRRRHWWTRNKRAVLPMATATGA